MHGHTIVKFIVAKQTKYTHLYKNTKEKLYKTTTAIWYNKVCRDKQLTPNYITIEFHPTPGTKRLQLHKMYQSRCTAKNSWWWAERLPQTCRVVIPIKLEFSASVGFILKEFLIISGARFLCAKNENFLHKHGSFDALFVSYDTFLLKDGDKNEARVSVVI